MKKVIVGALCFVVCVFAWNYLYYYMGVLYIPNEEDKVACISKTEGNKLYVMEEDGYKEFEVRGVNLGFSKPGYYATEDAVTKDEYLTWIGQIQDMGANVISVEKMGPKQFYDALYEYNIENDDPIYLIQGVSVDDYLINSIYGALDEEFYKPFLHDCKMTVDAVHGRLKMNSSNGLFPTHYNRDVSQWLFGYILGGEWETNLVAYTNHSYEQLEQYSGRYLYTADGTNFEIFLAEMGDELISYEMDKYGVQKSISFANWTMTDPLSYDEELEAYFKKAAKVDVEHIKTRKIFHAGQFASYRVYPAYPDFFNYMDFHEQNTYKQYLSSLTAHHSMPVVISGFGASSSRALSAQEKGLGRNQGHQSETEQGKAILSMYDDIMASGCAGGMIYEWQDEWYKTTWNSVAGINDGSVAYWSDSQSCEQSYGLLSFDPGDSYCKCYVDGDVSEWSDDDLVSDHDGVKLYMKYDEEFIYFMVDKPGFEIGSDKLYIPIDTTPKSGSKIAENLGISMSRAADFCIEIDGYDNSRIWVQDRYDMLSALFYEEVSAQNFFSKEFPETDSSMFTKINMLQQEELFFVLSELDDEGSDNDAQITFKEYDSYNPYHYKTKAYYETGKLEYGNANPDSVVYDSLADFFSRDGYVEMRIPWQLLNFADPVRMFIHDDYYENYGVEYISIQHIAAGAGDGEKKIEMEEKELKPLSKTPAYHERLKKSYFLIKDYWNGRRERTKEERK